MKEEGIEGIWDQFKNNRAKPYKGGITIDHIKEAVDYIFKDLPRENVGKGYKTDPYIDVYQDKEEGIISYAIKNLSGISFKCGTGGFINMIEMSEIMKFYPIKFNGEVLDEKQTKQFWEQYEDIKKKYNGRKD